MKIISVDIIRLTTGRGPIKGEIWNPTAVRINTDEGISGFGEIGLAYSPVTHSSFGVLRDFAELIIGMDPMEHEKIWDKLYNATFWVIGGGGVMFGGVSAIDIALWDIKGKALNQPVYKLLGGKLNPKLRAYASQLQLDWGRECRRMTQKEEYAEATHRALEQGYTAIKVNPLMFNEKGELFGRYTGLLETSKIRLAAERVEAIREAGGEDLDIMIELHAITDARSATQVCRALEPYNIFVCEEPTVPMSADNHLELKRNTTIPLAAGERLYSRWGFKPYFESQAIALAQPDLGNCGGITEGKKIADMAKAYDIGVQAHICGGPLATAAALQFEAALPNFVIHEVHASVFLEENMALGTHVYHPENGYYEIPDLPGIGQEISEEALRHADIVTIQ